MCYIFFYHSSSQFSLNFNKYPSRALHFCTKFTWCFKIWHISSLILLFIVMLVIKCSFLCLFWWYWFVLCKYKLFCLSNTAFILCQRSSLSTRYPLRLMLFSYPVISCIFLSNLPAVSLELFNLTLKTSLTP